MFIIISHSNSVVFIEKRKEIWVKRASYEHTMIFFILDVSINSFDHPYFRIIHAILKNQFIFKRFKFS